MAAGLRDRLIGAWILVSYVEETVEGSELVEPLGPHPQGIIMYTPDGYMSAQLAKPDRPKSSTGDWFAGTAEDYTNEASSYIAYTGPFHVDEEAQTLTHTMFISLFPDWTGQTQPRAVKIDGNFLHLGTVSPIRSSGKTVNSRLTWERAAPN
jgi:hypothetical protein